MLPNSHILLIDDAPSSRHDLSVILSFLGEEAVITTSATWQQDVEAQAAGPSTCASACWPYCRHR